MKTHSFYERHVEDYQKITNLWFPKRHKKLIGLINENPGRVLDVGCGTGAMLGRIEDRFPEAELYGIDFSKPMIKFAKSKYPNYHFQVSNAEKLPFENEGFDLVTNSISFHHYQNPDQALKEAHRVLKGSGRFLLMDITPKRVTARRVNDFAARHIIRDGHVKFLALEHLQAMLKKVGFSNIEQYLVGFPGVYITSAYKN